MPRCSCMHTAQALQCKLPIYSFVESLTWYRNLKTYSFGVYNSIDLTKNSRWQFLFVLSPKLQNHSVGPVSMKALQCKCRIAVNAMLQCSSWKPYMVETFQRYVHIQHVNIYYFCQNFEGQSTFELLFLRHHMWWRNFEDRFVCSTWKIHRIHQIL